MKTLQTTARAAGHHVPRSGWLASVTCAEEARLALTAGATIIDAKNPQTGALGALPMRAVLDIVHTASGRALVSATVGDLTTMDPLAVRAAALDMAATGVDLVKIGLFPAATLGSCIEGNAAITSRHKLVGVLFADQLARYHDVHPFDAVLQRLAASGWYGVMLDTANKRAGGLLRHCTVHQLNAFIALAHRHGMHCGLAGSLRLADIPALLAISPDVLGFRGALCSTGLRTAGLDTNRLFAVACAMRRTPRPHSSQSPDSPRQLRPVAHYTHASET